VQAVQIPQSGEAPKVAWQGKLSGTPTRMLAADEKLFVITHEGSLYAFGAKAKSQPATPSDDVAVATPNDAWTKSATEILEATRIRDGFAVVLGVDSGRLVEELVRQSNLHVIAIAQDAERADRLRQRLDRAGLNGLRASVHAGDPLTYPLPPYLANLVASETWGTVDRFDNRKCVEACYRVLRPYGGTACLTIPASSREAFVEEVARLGDRQAKTGRKGDWLLLSREGPLPGSAGWSHAEADAANSGASEDQFAKAPLELLWFDTPKRWIRTHGATLVRVDGGRMLLKADKLTAVDVFTGRQLWETPLPFPHTTNDQLVLLEDAIYVAGGRTCVVLDPATGQQRQEVQLPEEATAPWSNLRVWHDYLVGQSGKLLVCFPRRGSAPAWKFECGKASLSVAVGGGRVYCAELVDWRRGETDASGASTRALDIATGKTLWSVQGGSEVRYAEHVDRLVNAAGIYNARDGQLVAPLPIPPTADPKLRPDALPRPLFVVGDRLLFGTAETFTVYDLQSGKPEGDATVWLRRGCTIPRASANMVTTRVRGNAACIDLASREFTRFWNVRAACSNNLFPADGVLNMPSLTGGCTCNYLPVSQVYVPASSWRRGTP
jgi:hypothetical protein